MTSLVGSRLILSQADSAAIPLFSFLQVRQFSKYISKSRTKRLPLTTKRVGKGYNKGNGARKEGIINSKGKFRKVPEMCTELIVPDLAGFTLKPYVGIGAKRGMREEIVQL
mmetsp:Transcript_17347/g.29329  ORF Transcript_17347/g.29329 Transcript_17347/m.29329 type:complete len:111 (+) Transcript_17347:33-365(+)